MRISSASGRKTILSRRCSTFFIAPAALHLGEMWQQDLCDFFEVTLGVGRLQMLMNRLEPPGTSRGRTGTAARS